jgi:hypothetical protein
MWLSQRGHRISFSEYKSGSTSAIDNLCTLLIFDGVGQVIATKQLA